MPRPSLLLPIFVAVSIWVVFTLYLFYQKPVSGGHKPKENGSPLQSALDRLSRLENEIIQQQKSAQELLQVVEKLATANTVRVDKSASNGRPKYTIQYNKKPAYPSTLKPVKEEPVIAVLVISCDRVTVKRCLDKLLQYRPSKEKFPIIVSQDCGHAATKKAIMEYASAVHYMQQPDLSDIEVNKNEKRMKGYFKISRHYKWALNQTFHHLNYSTVVIVEDDLEIAPDFYDYFGATWKVLVSDPTLWCVSAWNDNGKEGLIDKTQPQKLYRTDFFPGLGWMLTKELWKELSKKWPRAYWDDWVRHPDQRKGRACIRPEIPRTSTFGKVGISHGLFYDKHLKFIKLNDQPVPFKTLNLTFLLKGNYDDAFIKEVYTAPVVTLENVLANSIKEPLSVAVRIPYTTKTTFRRAAKSLKLMDDFKSGVPRTAYRGVVSFLHRGRRVYLAPSANWKGYDPTWS